MKKIPDHADRTTALLPTAHERTNWQPFVDGIVGRRGAWAEDSELYAIEAGHTNPAAVGFIARGSDMEALFGLGGGLFFQTTGAQIVSDESPSSEGFSLWRYTGPAVTFKPGITTQTIVDRIASGEMLALPSGLNNVQLGEWVIHELASAPWGIQELEGEFQKLHTFRHLSLAFGEQLDRLGEALGLTRDGDDDETYRVALAWKAAVNASNGTIEDILRMASTLETITQIQLLETFPAHMVVYFHGEIISARLRRLLQTMPREGVGISITSAESLRPFVFGPDGGWFRIVGVSGAVASLYDEPVDSFAIGDTVRVWDVLGNAAGVTRTVVSVDSVYDSVYDVTVDSAFGALPSGWTLLENVTRGVQDLDGFGFEDAYAIYEAVSGAKTLLLLGSALTELTVEQVVRVEGSTGNDGIYKINAVQAVMAGAPPRTSTKLTLVQALPSSVSDGFVEHVSPEYAKLRGVQDGVDSPHGELSDEWTSPA